MGRKWDANLALFDTNQSAAANAPELSNSAPISNPAPKSVCLFTNPPEAQNAPKFVTPAAVESDSDIPSNYRGPGAWPTWWEIRMPERQRMTDAEITASIETLKAQRQVHHDQLQPPASIEAFVSQVKTDVPAVEKPASEWVTLASRRMCKACDRAALGLFVARHMDKSEDGVISAAVTVWTEVVEWLHSLTFEQVCEVWA